MQLMKIPKSKTIKSQPFQLSVTDQLQHLIRKRLIIIFDFLVRKRLNTHTQTHTDFYSLQYRTDFDH